MLPDFGDTSQNSCLLVKTFFTPVPLWGQIQTRNFLRHPNCLFQKHNTPCLSEFQKIDISRNVKTAEVKKDIKRRAEIREAEDAQRRDEEYPLEIEGTRAQRLIDGTILDEKGERWRDNGDGTVSKIG